MTTKLKQILKEKNMTQKELADKSGLAEHVISRLANGRRFGTIIQWHYIAQTLGVSIDDLLEVRDGKN